MKPHEHLLLFAHPRSGSSSLYQVLQLHPDLHLLEEPFNENFSRWHPDNPNYRERVYDIPSLDRQLTAIFASHNGFKLLDYQLPDDLAAHVLQRPDCKILFLRRRNLLQAVVSVLLAHQTQLWKKWDMTQPLAAYYHDLRPLDLTDIQRRVAALHQHLAFFEALLDRRVGNAVMKLTYEELYFAPPPRQLEQLAALWDWLGLAPLTSDRALYYLQPAAVKLNSRATYELVPNAAAIQAYCGNDVTGWLYEEPAPR
jgi:hypothetical protein